MNEYAKILITVKALPKEIDKNELALSDEVYELSEKLEEWLKQQETPFKFAVDLR